MSFPDAPEDGCRTVGFSRADKCLARVMLYGAGAVSVGVVFWESRLLGALYLVLVLVTVVAALAFHCSRCTALSQHGECLSAPAALMRRLVRPRPGPVTGWDTAIVCVLMAGAVLVPQIWLVRHPALMALYWILLASSCAVFPLRFCRRCRFRECPFRMGGRG